MTALEILNEFRRQTIVIDGGSVLGPEEDARAFGQSLEQALQALHASVKDCIEETIIVVTNDLPSLMALDEVTEIRRNHKNEILKNVDDFFGGTK